MNNQEVTDSDLVFRTEHMMTELLTEHVNVTNREEIDILLLMMQTESLSVITKQSLVLLVNIEINKEYYISNLIDNCMRMTSNAKNFNEQIERLRNEGKQTSKLEEYCNNLIYQVDELVQLITNFQK